MNEKYLYGIIGLLLGIVLTWMFASSAVNNQNGGMMRMMGMRAMMNNSNIMDDHHDDDSMSDSMAGMMAGLSGKTGDEFDKAFLSEMIEHHEGAIEMAKAAQQNAKHQEIKDLANAIISAQTSEINQMKAWQQAWYK